jgi:hypothetical protein
MGAKQQNAKRQMEEAMLKVLAKQNGAEAEAE